ncbi:MAG: DNA polymerase III subunit delta' [Rhodospirillales bacterium]|nr:DNA polymerase III subunit delta' [Rhodospirillales bacterium]
MTEAGGVPAPRASSSLIGHETAERTLLDAFESGRLHHAWLICGQRGIGKATLAYRFARYLLSQGHDFTPPSGTGLFDDALLPSTDQGGSTKGILHVDESHPVFRRIASSGHADLVTVERQVDPKTDRKRAEIVVGDVRNIGGFMAKTPAEGGWRVVVIDAADEMNRNAANAVLKVLEEPPDRAILLLVCHNPGRLLPTILSRCRKITLQPLSDGAVRALLSQMAPEVSGDDIEILTKLSEGSIGRALELAEGGGVGFYRDILGLLNTLPNLDTERLHALGDTLGRRGNEDAFRTFTELFQWWLSRLILSGSRGGERLLAEEAPLAERLLSVAGLDRWLEVWEKIDRLFARAGGGGNLDRKQVFLNAFLSLEGVVRR